MLLDRLKSLLAGPSDSPSDPEAEIRTAAAALLLSMIRADHEVDRREREAVTTALARLTGRTGKELDQLIELAESEVDESVSLHDFTRILHRQQTREEKFDLVTCLWRVAAADGTIDPEEELLVRKVSTLLYLPHEEFIRAKQEALGS